VTTHRTAKFTLDEVAEKTGLARHTVERHERKALGKIIDAIFEDEKIRSRYGGCLVSVSTAITEELGITINQFVKYASKKIIRRYWCI